MAVLPVACIVVGNDFPRAAPDRQAEQDPGRVLNKAAPGGVLNKAAAIVEKKLDAFAVYITPAAQPLYSPQLQHSRHYMQIDCVFVIPPSRATHVLQMKLRLHALAKIVNKGAASEHLLGLHLQ